MFYFCSGTPLGSEDPARGEGCNCPHDKSLCLLPSSRETTRDASRVKFNACDPEKPIVTYLVPLCLENETLSQGVAVLAIVWSLP